MSGRQRVLLGAAVVGTVVPRFFFGRFFLIEGWNPILFMEQLFATDPASGFVFDVLISLVIFWAWSYADSRRNEVRHWWLVIPSGMTVGLSLALPLYLLMRASHPTAD